MIQQCILSTAMTNSHWQPLMVSLVKKRILLAHSAQ